MDKKYRVTINLDIIDYDEDGDLSGEGFHLILSESKAKLATITKARREGEESSQFLADILIEALAKPLSNSENIEPFLDKVKIEVLKSVLGKDPRQGLQLIKRYKKQASKFTKPEILIL